MVHMSGVSKVTATLGHHLVDPHAAAMPATFLGSSV